MVSVRVAAPLRPRAYGRKKLWWPRLPGTYQVLDTALVGNRVLAENSVGLGSLLSVSHVKSIPTHEKKNAYREKVAPRPLLT